MPVPTRLTMMSYNLRYPVDLSPNSWEERRSLVRDLIKRHSPDLIGTQEGFFRQIKDLDDGLPDYNWLGLGRGGGSKSEYMAIFYKKDKFELMEYDHFWLSDTPNTIGSISWGNLIPRMASWCRFVDRDTKESFYHLNTHLDNKSETARIEGARLIAKKAAELDPELPIIVTGDFNSAAGSLPHDILIQAGGFRDSWLEALDRIGEDLGTSNHFHDETGGGIKRRIDWIMFRGCLTVERTQIINDRYNGQFPSDHFPILAEFTLQQAPDSAIPAK